MTDEGTATLHAADIADALARVRGAAVPHPTAQQAAVIEAPLAPALVVAGAGSGKTETMANRVLWLLATGAVRPGEILGLTFTRKAAGELATRIRERIAELDAAGLLPASADPFEAPVVATYNAFANTLYRDHAILLGREGDAPVLGEAAAWQLARSIVLRSRDPRLPELGRGLDAVTDAVLRIARGLAEHAGDPDAVRSLAREAAALADLPSGSPRYEYADALTLAGDLAALDLLVDLAEAYGAEKQRRGVVEYSDQVVLALRVAQRQPRIGEELRERYKVVLLDEYQDTSVVQTRLLAELFGGGAVMAVGDPNQSIYGWRGASAANLEQFAGLFGAGEARYALSTSWRNGGRVLDAANALVEPFRIGARVAVERLAPSPVASAHPLDALFTETLAEEAAGVADWLGARLAERRADGSIPSAAMLLRTRRAQPAFLAALRERGIPFHVLGVGGLLAEPEIADLVATLTVLADPEAGIELVRVLAGPRWRIGPADLHALSRVASWLKDRDAGQHLLEADVRRALRDSVAPGEGGSIVEALDMLGTAASAHSQWEGFSPAGRERLRDAARTLAWLRGRAALELPDFIALVVQTLDLDLEVAANEYRVAGRANLDAFSDALQGYLAIAEVATLSGFLGWLREAEQREDLSPRPEEPEPGTVQVLTVHGAKGLEWDAVAVPRMVVDELPARPLEGYRGWLGFGQYPWPLRGDAEELPTFAFRAATTRKELLDAEKAYTAGVRERVQAEERRLAYVAVTRARHRLLVSGSFWATQTKPREASPFLVELAAAGLIGELPAPPEKDAANPLGDDLERMTWPADPLGTRRPFVAAAADLVARATPSIDGRWRRDLELLLAEREARAAAAGAVPLPTRVSASRFKDYVTHPDEVAAATARPMPERPYRATRLGTLFHSWVEERFGLEVGSDALDADVTELDDLGDPTEAADLARLQATFATSRWADRKPVEVEREIHLPFAGRIVICKIDAVYREDDGRYQVVDWKTGKAPRDAADLEAKQLQLALYRLAYAHWAGVPLADISAAFYFVAEDRVIEPAHIDDEAELLARWNAAFGPAAAPVVE